MSRWIPVGLAGLALAAASIVVPDLAFAGAADPAADATPYMSGFPLFRSANMTFPDKLATGIGFHSFRIPAVVRTGTGRLLAFA